MYTTVELEADWHYIINVESSLDFLCLRNCEIFTKFSLFPLSCSEGSHHVRRVSHKQPLCWMDVLKGFLERLLCSRLQCVNDEPPERTRRCLPVTE